MDALEKAELQESLGLMTDCHNRIKCLMNDTLDLTLLERDKISLESISFDLYELMSQAILNNPYGRNRIISSKSGRICDMLANLREIRPLRCQHISQGDEWVDLFNLQTHYFTLPARYRLIARSL